MSQDPKKSVSRESDKFMLRFPEGMREHVADAAAHNRRSMNAEILDRLERTFRWDEVDHPHPGDLQAEVQADAEHLQDLMRELRMLQIARSTPNAPSAITDDEDIDLLDIIEPATDQLAAATNSPKRSRKPKD